MSSSFFRETTHPESYTPSPKPYSLIHQPQTLNPASLVVSQTYLIPINTRHRLMPHRRVRHCFVARCSGRSPMAGARMMISRCSYVRAYACVHACLCVLCAYVYLYVCLGEFDCRRVLFGSRVAKREAQGTAHTKYQLNLDPNPSA